MIRAKILDSLLELIYPNVCGICGKINRNSLCDECKRKMRSIIVAKIVDYKRDNLKFFDKHAYLFKYDGKIRSLILNYKFDNKAYLYKTFTQFVLNNQNICNFIKSYNIIIPVPIHKKKFNSRGYNQSELIAKELANKMNSLKLETKVLIKVKNNMAQSTLNKEDRILNVKNAYEVINKQIIKDKRVLLLDDIYTTGNTVNECSKVLKYNGAKEIGILTIAKD